MKNIISTYKINSHTQALLPAKSINYQTIVIEENKILYVRQTPLEIIRQGCVDDWSDYVSRRNAVMHHTSFIQRLPIPVNIRKAFYFFPTHSPGHSDNCWIAYQHILIIDKPLEDQAGNPAQSVIYFKNNQKLFLVVSLHTLEKQIQRTFQCKYLIEGAETLRWG